MPSPIGRCRPKSLGTTPQKSAFVVPGLYSIAGGRFPARTFALVMGQGDRETWAQKLRTDYHPHRARRALVAKEPRWHGQLGVPYGSRRLRKLVRQPRGLPGWLCAGPPLISAAS